ncbi:MAG: nucleotide-binding protein [Gemmatimonadota bacterium]
MRLAIAGKGGTGKTTIAGTLARLLARRGRRVLAIDADTNPNLAATLGLGPTGVETIAALPRGLMERRTGPDGTTEVVFTRTPDEVLAEYGASAPDGVQLLVMGRVGHGGAG